MGPLRSYATRLPAVAPRDSGRPHSLALLQRLGVGV